MDLILELWVAFVSIAFWLETMLFIGVFYKPKFGKDQDENIISKIMRILFQIMGICGVIFLTYGVILFFTHPNDWGIGIGYYSTGLAILFFVYAEYANKRTAQKLESIEQKINQK